MSYITTVDPLADVAVSSGSGLLAGVVHGRQAPASGVAERVGGALAAAVFLVVMGGLSLTFCAMLAGPF